MTYWKITTVTHSLDKKSLIVSKLLLQNKLVFCKGKRIRGKDEVYFDIFSCIGFAQQGFGSRGATGVASVRSC